MARLALPLSLAAALGACGGGAASAGGEGAPVDPAPAAAAPEDAEAPAWLGRLEEQGMLTYEVQLPGAAAPVEVRLLVQQRVARGASVAVRLVPIGTPLGEEPVYPQWLVATPEAICGLEEAASLTTPGFVPIDDAGGMRTEATAAELWRVEARWLRVGADTGGAEAAVGWTLAERVGSIEQPVAADDCVRLERSDETARSALLACGDVGLVERRDESEERTTTWRLVAIGERPSELE